MSAMIVPIGADGRDRKTEVSRLTTRQTDRTTTRLSDEKLCLK